MGYTVIRQLVQLTRLLRARASIDYHAKEYQAEQLELELGQVGVI